MTQRLVPVCLIALASGVALAKLPAPDAATKAKTDETAAKAAWQAKVDTYKLCKTQDRIAARFGKKGPAKGAASAAGATRTATTAPPGGAAPSTASASAAAVTAEAKPAPGPASAAASTADKTTPVSPAGAAPAPCADPGPFAYNPPEQTPLETSGAHSPAGTAASPPSTRPEAATSAPAK